MLTNFDTMYKGVVEAIRDEYERVIASKNEEIAHMSLQKPVLAKDESRVAELERENDRLSSELAKK
jgi:cell shape-determining protein MreC